MPIDLGTGMSVTSCPKLSVHEKDSVCWLPFNLQVGPLDRTDRIFAYRLMAGPTFVY